ncbi:MAG TPA: Druantia anti-phage system protein DruA, partial [Pseudodesulfovibrio sp.]|nr:Druantia anti-phage system protein DruA [Pseudodesulfovibrio sp.]
MKPMNHCPSKASLEVRLASNEELGRFDRLLRKHHYLGASPPVGDFLRQVVVREGQWVALLVWGPAALKLRERERWIGWNPAMALERLKLVVQNRRYLLLRDRGQEPNLASQVLAAACRALPAQWQASFGYRPLIAESFTDPEAFHGTCYKASGWEPVGLSKGHRRHRADYYLENDHPKKLWLKELCAEARSMIRAAPLAPEHAPAVVEPSHGVLPLNQPQRCSLVEVLRQAPDPRGKNTRFRIGPVLSIVAMALLCGARQISEIARFAPRLRPAQRAELGLPIKKGTRAFREIPSYSVFYEVLTRMDPEPFARLLSDWLAQQAGTLPGALALDGKMIRDILGTVSLVDAEDGSPVAVGIM